MYIHFNIDHNEIEYMLIKTQYSIHIYYGVLCCAFLHFGKAEKRSVVLNKSFRHRKQRAPPE